MEEIIKAEKDAGHIVEEIGDQLLIMVHATKTKLFNMSIDIGRIYYHIPYNSLALFHTSHHTSLVY